MAEMQEVIEKALKGYVPDEDGNPFAAWAGECGLFVDVACHVADKLGVPYEIGNAYDGKLEGDFIWNPPIGLSTEDVRELRIIENLNHIWLIHRGRHFDASTPAGVAELFDLRLVRQVAVELIGRADPCRLERLVAEHAYWRESAALFEAYMSIHSRLAEKYALSSNERVSNSPSL